MHFKKILTSLMSTLLVLSISTYNVYASENNWLGALINSKKVSKEDVETSLNNIDDISTQVDNLYKVISDNVKLEEKYIRTLHVLAGGKAIYFDKKANIYNDKTVKSYYGPMHIVGANTSYKKAEFIECADETILRPSSHYLPDAVYSVSYDVKALMTQRLFYNRGANQEYFNTLTDDTKNNLLFYEAVLLYTGESLETIDNLFLAYMEILTAKGANENIIETVNGNLCIKDSYLEILNRYGFVNERTINYLAIMLSYDENIAVYDNPNYITNTNILPYIKNYTSRENMMVSAISLNGKVRYIWGGGHDTTANIDGINPSWYSFSEAYPNTQTSEVISIGGNGKETKTTVYNQGFKECIKSASYWCPLHGNGDTEFHGKTVFSPKDYLSIRENIIDYDKYSYDEYMSILSQIKFSGGINEHLIDGLDCSGYTSWVYNQITDKYTFNTSARYFSYQEGMKQLGFGSKLLPGDVFAWESHIVLVVGKVKDNSKAYVVIEQTPNILRFGVIYYNGALIQDINEATKIANEANSLIGGINNNDEPANVRCMNTVGEELSIGRFKGKFEDEGIIISEYNKSIEDMTAQEIIQYTLTKLPMSYVLGYNIYDGDLFNKELISSNLGITLPELE